MRPNTTGPKISLYNKASIYADTVNLLEHILSSSIGVTRVVKKTRHVYIVGRTRIHIDNVDNLGNFIELEVCESFYCKTLSVKINNFNNMMY